MTILLGIVLALTIVAIVGALWFGLDKTFREIENFIEQEKSR